jgi:hypothetical protein
MFDARPADWARALARQTQEHPGRTVALTLGTGFILGGGLFSPLTARIVGLGVRLGLRLVALPIVVDALGALAASVLIRDQEAPVPDAASDSRPETINRRRTHEAQ